LNQVFQHIATVSFQHEFFPESGFSGFEITVSPESERRFLNLQFHIKRYNTGFYIFSSSPELAVNEISPIHFHINFKDSFFWNYTDLKSTMQRNHVLFLDNSIDEKSPYFMGINTTFTSSQFIFLNKNDLKNVSKYVGAALQIKNSAGEIFPYPESLGYGSGFFEEGFFSTVSKSDFFPFYHINGNSFKTPDMILSFSPEILYHKTLNAKPLNYSLQFTAKKTFWKYILVDKVYENFQKLSVIDLTNTDVIFSKSEIQISPNIKATCFVSNQALSFCGEDNRRFQLVDQSNTTSKKSKIILKSLPLATAEMLHATENESEFDSSHIFI
tara:strand:+ start:395377 stop:396360 length:984 start_codon:yes stop_codon:yes gene_type:complete